jgi:hypothetical protein
MAVAHWRLIQKQMRKLALGGSCRKVYSKRTLYVVG